MTNLTGTNVLLGISGGIAAYKSAELTRLLIKQNANVRVCMTPSAIEFITPLTLQALSGNPVHTDLFDVEAEAAMGHIELAKWADVIVVAPATANTIAKIAHGRADNLLTTLVLASKAKLYIAPAMNQAMWANPQTTANIKQLEQNKICLLGPDAGEQACGDIGLGRMLEPAEIIDQIIAESTATPSLQGVSVLITAGPTREALDPVRYLTNRSSGKMGYAIAEAAKKQGAQVTLVSGPVHLDTPANIETINVESAQQMFSAVRKHAKQADIFIACAAVADFSPATTSNNKIKKNSDTETLELTLTKNPDILAETSHAHPNLFTVGFAAETTDLEKYAKGKLISKKLNMIAANKVGKNQGFDKDDNALLVLWEGGKCTLPLTSKKHLSQQLVQLISENFEIYKHHLPSKTPTNTHDEQDV
ncbi:MAG TPA: bifunctional phosphopantothenoylcysteine decarboxylase/phosphopantothenate--cysteine ligase CoaBC [Thiothrix sp.]|nr:bifunctional phosphopantothenoylcysteine decarboxylase/phosphopantothenate--cysteine ligase CoaBC [Thiothrix sp.]